MGARLAGRQMRQGQGGGPLQGGPFVGSTGFDVHVVHRDGQELDAPVEVTFSGTQSLDPRRIEHAPGKLTYVAGEQQGDRASVTLTSTSRRGIGKLEKAIEVETQAYRMVGGAAKLKVDDVVCDITKPFTVSGSNITLDFTPREGDPSGGTYSYRGDFGKFSVSGTGTYTLQLTDRGGTIIGKGKGKATGPLGTFSNSGKERYESSRRRAASRPRGRLVRGRQAERGSDVYAMSLSTLWRGSSRTSVAAMRVGRSRRRRT